MSVYNYQVNGIRLAGYFYLAMRCIDVLICIDDYQCVYVCVCND